MEKCPAVYVICRFFDENAFMETLKTLLPDVEIVLLPLLENGKISKESMDLIKENAEVVFTSPFHVSEFLFSCKRLKWLQTMSAGVDRIFKAMDSTQPFPNIRLTRTGSSAGRPISEYVLGQILAWERHFYPIHDNQKKREWYRQPYRIARLLSSLRIGILGAGQIGTEIGSKCKAAGMQVWTLSRTERETIQFDNHMTTNKLPFLLENCDFVCSILPSTPKTRGLLSGDMLQHCHGKKSVFINVGRGDVIDERSILKALRKGWIGGAILDVLEKEPLPNESELWHMANVVITPHLSSANTTHEPHAKHFAENYRNYINGEALVDEVNWQEGY